MLPAYIFDRQRGRKFVVGYVSNNGVTFGDFNCKGIVRQLIIFVKIIYW